VHINKICLIIYYSPICLGRFCDHHQGVIQEYEQYTIIYCLYFCVTYYLYSCDTLKMVAEATKTCQCIIWDKAYFIDVHLLVYYIVQTVLYQQVSWKWGGLILFFRFMVPFIVVYICIQISNKVQQWGMVTSPQLS
jgi:hypothetical protein